MRFDVDGAAWSWCFPRIAEPDGQVRRSQIRALVLRPAPHGMDLEAIPAQQDGSSQVVRLNPATAARLAEAGVPVFIHCSLVVDGPEAITEIV